jgi:hypothetical protein
MGKLSEEDLVAGKAWVHPETRLEYADFHAWFAGEKPVAHWRNNRIREILAACKGRLDDPCIPTDYGRGPRVTGRSCIDDLVEYQDRLGEYYDHRPVAFSTVPLFK